MKWLDALTLAILALVLVLVISGFNFSLWLSPWTLVAYVPAVSLLLVHLVPLWIHPLKTYQMESRLVFGGHFVDTVVTSKYNEDEEVQDFRKRIAQEDDGRHQNRLRYITTAWFGNIVLVPWPIASGLILPTSTLSLPMHVGNVFTKEDVKKPRKREEEGNDAQESFMPSHRGRLAVKTTIAIRLSPLVVKLLQTIALDSWKGIDWTEKCTFKDNDGHEYTDRRLSQEMLPFVQPLILEAVRTAATKFTWLGNRDINEKKADYEDEVIKVLREPESPLVHAGLFRRKHDSSEGKAEDQKEHLGESALTVDVQIERITFDTLEPNASDLAKASDKPLVAQLEARAEQSRRRGEGLGVKAFAKAIGVDDPKYVRDGDVVQQVDNVNLTGYSRTLVKEIAEFLRGSKPVKPPKKTP